MDHIARLQAKDTLARSSLPPKLAAALGAKPKDSAPGPESSMQVGGGSSDGGGRATGVVACRALGACAYGREGER